MGAVDVYSVKAGKTVLSNETVSMMANEYEYDSKHNQEDQLYSNLCELVKSHELLRDRLEAARETIREMTG